MDDLNQTEGGHSRRSVLGLAAGAALTAGAIVSEPGRAEAQQMGPASMSRATISMAGAHMALMAAVAKADEIKVPMTIVICDESGHMKAAARMDGSSFGSIEIVTRKAITSAGFRAPTGVFGQRVWSGDPARAASFANLPTAWLGGGGVPIMVDNQLIGAIGVGGGTPEQDHDVAQAGADALKGK